MSEHKPLSERLKDPAFREACEKERRVLDAETEAWELRAERDELRAKVADLIDQRCAAQGAANNATARADALAKALREADSTFAILAALAEDGNTRDTAIQALHAAAAARAALGDKP